MGREIAAHTGTDSAIGRMKAGRVVADKGCSVCGRRNNELRVKTTPAGLVAVCKTCRTKYGESKAFARGACKALGIG